MVSVGSVKVEKECWAVINAKGILCCWIQTVLAVPAPRTAISLLHELLRPPKPWHQTATEGLRTTEHQSAPALQGQADPCHTVRQSRDFFSPPKGKKQWFPPPPVYSPLRVPLPNTATLCLRADNSLWGQRCRTINVPLVFNCHCLIFKLHI